MQRELNLAHDKRIRPIEKDLSARLVARALTMDTRLAFSEDIVSRFSGFFYPDFGKRKGYCLQQREGWSDLKWTVGESLRTSCYGRLVSELCLIPDNVRQAIEAEDAVLYCMHLAIAGQKFNMKHLRMIVELGRFRLLAGLIGKIQDIWGLISPRDLLLWTCADGRFNDEGAACIVRAIERKAEGTVASTRDVFGDTPLWYTLYRYQHGGHSSVGAWHELTPELVKELKRHGCDPNAKNSLNVSWEEVRRELLCPRSVVKYGR